MGKMADWLWGTETRSDIPPATNSGDNHTARTAPPRDIAPLGVNAAEAVTLSTVYAAITLITNAMKQCSLDVYRNDAKVTAPLFIRQPNTDMSQRQFIELLVASLATDGNAFVKVDRGPTGTVLNLSALDPRAVQVQLDPKTGAVTGYLAGTTTLRADEVKHLKLFRRPGEAKGLGPIAAAARDIRSAIDTRDFASDIFRNSGVPTRGFLKSDQALSAEQAGQVRDSWTDAAGDPYGVPVLGSGFDYRSVAISPKDAQWLESQRFSTTGIARIFHIPANLLLADIEGTSQTYTNVSQSWVEFSRFGLAPFLLEIEDALSSLIPGGAVVRFNLEALLRADAQTRYTTYQLALSSGWLTKNEVRAIEGLDPIDGGDALPAAAPAPAPTPTDPSEAPND
jgi:HK97 family phage portal protein